MKIKGIEKCDAVFVDFFDTLVFRHVTASETVRRWAVCLKKKYPQLSDDTVRQLPGIRQKTFKELRDQLAIKGSGISEVTYEHAIGQVFNEISSEYGLTDKESFLRHSKIIDIAVELGCLYVNSKLVKELEHAKAMGKKIYCVSDFYLGKPELLLFMKSVGISDTIFDDIFVSCDVGKRKATGDIFPYLLDKLSLEASRVVMIGDNKSSDNLIPNKYGLMIDFHPNLAYKCKTHLLEKLRRNYASCQIRRATDEMYRCTSNYSEYIGIFYVFTKRLYKYLSEEAITKIAFMAREGYYLKQLFEVYQDMLIPANAQITTKYYWCSRRSVMSGVKEAHTPEVMDEDISLRNWLKSLNLSLKDARKFEIISDEEADEVRKLSEQKGYCKLIANPRFMALINRTIEANRKAFLKYTEPYIQEGTFSFVDSGWKCTTQNTIEKYYGIKTNGYYIGIQKPDKPILPLKCRGLIFSEDNPRSKYYEFLGTNIPFYQQLLAAPHGTALKYYDEEGSIHVLEEWDEMEKELYFETIKPVQELMLLKFKGICAWDDKPVDDKKEEWVIARLSMRSSLFAKGDRLPFIRKCTDNYVQNFRQENRGAVKYDDHNVKIGFDCIWSPDKLIRYFSKVQRTSVYDKRVIRMIYPVAARMLYGYVILFRTIKNFVNR